MQVDLRAPESIKPYQGNPRVNDTAIEAVAASLREFGFRQPVVVDEDGGVIVVGHTRWKAAQKLGLGASPKLIAFLVATSSCSPNHWHPALWTDWRLSRRHWQSSFSLCNDQSV